MTNLTHRPSALSFSTLRSIKQDVQNTLLLTGRYLRRLQQDEHCDTHQDVEPATPLLNMPLPEDIDQTLDEFTLSPEIRAAVSHKYQQSLQQIQRVHRQKYEESCRALARLPQSSASLPLPLLIDELRKVYESTYSTHYLPIMKKEIVDLCSNYTSNSAFKKTPFNTEYIPLLERYFELNAYPSAPDRQLLAQKSKMTPRQIEVWFQNHRKRAKENGKPVNKIPPHMTQATFYFLNNRATSAAASDGHSSDDEDYQLAAEKNEVLLSIETSSTLFGNSSPLGPHVFPNRFKPSNIVQRMPCESGKVFAFPPPIWPRKTTSRSMTLPQIHFDDFVAAFASKLTLRDTVKSKRRSRLRKSNPWFFATTTIPSAAPHPAFIRCTRPREPIELSTPLHQRSQKASPFPKRRPSKFHPYARFSRYSITQSLGDYNGSVYGTSLPDFTASSSLLNVSAPLSESWITTLESEILGRDIQDPASPSTMLRVSSDQSTTSCQSVSLGESSSLSGSRSSSLSSIQSSIPSTPPLLPQGDDTPPFDHTDLFLGDMSDFDQMLTSNSGFPFSDDIFSNKTDGLLAYALPCIRNSLPPFPPSAYLQALS